MKTKVIFILVAILLIVGCGSSRAKHKQTEFFVTTHYGVARMGPSIDYKVAGEINPGDVWVVLGRNGDWIRIQDDPAVFIYSKFGRVETVEYVIRTYVDNVRR